MEISFQITAIMFMVWCMDSFTEGGQYTLYFSESRNWADSQNRCIDKQRVLASITAMDDQDIVERLEPYVESFFWIGMFLNGTSNQFQWSDNSPVSWTYWAEGFPGTDPASGCVRIRPFDFRWETHNCSQNLHYLCEDTTYKRSLVVSLETKVKGVLFGLGVIGGIMILLCLLLQSPCCRRSVSDRIARIGFGTKDLDRKPII